MSKIKTFIRPITWLGGMSTGYGNGYAIIPKDNPLHGKGYDDIDISIHGGLTFSDAAKDLNWPEIEEEDKDGWVIGFDTAHCGDDLESCSKEYVEKETENLAIQIAEYK